MKGTRHQRLLRFVQDVREHTPFATMILLLFSLWLLFSSAVYVAERAADSPMAHYGTALYWGVAAFSTAGISDAPQSGVGKLLGGIWMTVGSLLYFGTIVATATAYFMRPLQRPARQIIDTIEYNLEQIDELSTEELELLKRTVDDLIEQMEQHAGRRM